MSENAKNERYIYEDGYEVPFEFGYDEMVNHVDKLVFRRIKQCMLVDALIKNFDRHPGNITFIKHRNQYIDLMPLYDFGASFFDNGAEQAQLGKTYYKLETHYDTLRQMGIVVPDICFGDSFVDNRKEYLRGVPHTEGHFDYDNQF